MTNDILDDLADLHNNLIFSIESVNKLLKDRKARRTWVKLLDDGLVELVGKKHARLTDMAKINLLAQIVARRKPDGKSRLVVFDIPERKRTKRNVVRRHLKELGFKQWQKSVWICDLPCEDLVEVVVRFHGLEKYMKLFIGEGVPYL